MSNQLKLWPAFVPDSLKRRSVFYTLGRNKEWKKIRESVKISANGTCEICGVKRDKYMVCHEDWHYDDKEHVATLTCFMWVCPDCNNVLHRGGSGSGWSGNEFDDPLLIALPHLMKVNGIAAQDAFNLISEAQREHTERSKYEWTITINPALFGRFPILAGLHL